jgi:hypothetical protein
MVLAPLSVMAYFVERLVLEVKLPERGDATLPRFGAVWAGRRAPQACERELPPLPLPDKPSTRPNALLREGHGRSSRDP